MFSRVLCAMNEPWNKRHQATAEQPRDQRSYATTPLLRIRPVLLPFGVVYVKMFQNVLDYLTGDKLDEKLGMTEKQKRLVRNTWSIARKNEMSAGIAIMLALFKSYPKYQKQFKSFKDVPYDELPKNKKFQAHSLNVISAFDKLIEYMHDPELLEANLTNLAEKHKARGQTQEQFENLKQVLIDLFPSLFGKSYTPEAQEAWKKVLDLVFSTIYQVYEH